MKKYKVYYSYYIEGVSDPWGKDTVVISVTESSFENMFNELIAKFEFEADQIGYDAKEIDRIEECEC